MKKRLVLSVTALAVLLSCGIAFTAEKTRGKPRAEKQKISAEEKAWKEKLEAMTPEQRKVAIAERALEMDLAPWKEVRKIAESEKATKTVAAIDKIIATKQEEFKKKLQTAEKRQAGEAKEKTSRQGTDRAKQGKRKASAQAEGDDN